VVDQGSVQRRGRGSPPQTEAGEQLTERVDRAVAGDPVQLASGAVGIHHGQRHEQLEETRFDRDEPKAERRRQRRADGSRRYFDRAGPEHLRERGDIDHRIGREVERASHRPEQRGHEGGGQILRVHGLEPETGGERQDRDET
jgi:hypothetical protein